MPQSNAASNSERFDRRRQVAAILAQGVLRYRRRLVSADAEKISQFGDSSLEIVSNPRLTVSTGFAGEPM